MFFCPICRFESSLQWTPFIPSAYKIYWTETDCNVLMSINQELHRWDFLPVFNKNNAKLLSFDIKVLYVQQTNRIIGVLKTRFPRFLFFSSVQWGNHGRPQKKFKAVAIFSRNLGLCTGVGMLRAKLILWKIM